LSPHARRGRSSASCLRRRRAVDSRYVFGLDADARLARTVAAAQTLVGDAGCERDELARAYTTPKHPALGTQVRREGWPGEGRPQRCRAADALRNNQTGKNTVAATEREIVGRSVGVAGPSIHRLPDRRDRGDPMDRARDGTEPGLRGRIGRGSVRTRDAPKRRGNLAQE
jgi:hypothetical protein